MKMRYTNHSCYIFPDDKFLLSSVTTVNHLYSWTVRFAPPPEDIYWENLNDAHRLFFFKALLINIFLFIVLFFFTSPTYIITQVQYM